MTQATKEYKRTIKFHKKQYNKRFCKRLRDIKTTDPRTFWKLLKGKQGLEMSQISLETMFEFFQKNEQQPKQ